MSHTERTGDHPSEADTPATAVEFWEDRYAGAEQIWTGRPNAALVDEVTDLPAGHALDLGCGEGGDAVWLAARGWTVTAVDISRNALARTEAAAARAGVAERVTTERHDLAESTPAGRFDLVSACFLQTPYAFDRAGALRRLAAQVTAGGTVLIIDHAAAPSGSTHHDVVFPTPQETLVELQLDPAQWTTVAVEQRTRTGTRADGTTSEFLDGVLVLRRNDPAG
ncbi:class I SAM-dependent methyltransferase [Nakamurella leprariae]|uniref:Methyltransferase domain-containing protein n=1 Tax=Nakamurella leprariae TaxID=2803911 RepID=A0A939BXI4_9ACTN|nr:methyltransferase domain-containing protein [Nakamurella leprariae]MBM9466015.1 methyltransferase domain-containing protein [Nakamurella leprariae]